MSTADDRDPQPVLFIGEEIKSPPFSDEARREVGQLLGLLQDGFSIGMPQSRPMPSIGPSCHELRVRDEDAHWRIFYRIESDIILVILIAAKTTRATPKHVIDLCKRRLREFDAR